MILNDIQESIFKYKNGTIVNLNDLQRNLCLFIDYCEDHELYYSLRYLNDYYYNNYIYKKGLNKYNGNYYLNDGYKIWKLKKVLEPTFINNKIKIEEYYIKDILIHENIIETWYEGKYIILEFDKDDLE